VGLLRDLEWIFVGCVQLIFMEMRVLLTDVNRQIDGHTRDMLYWLRD